MRSSLRFAWAVLITPVLLFAWSHAAADPIPGLYISGMDAEDPGPIVWEPNGQMSGEGQVHYAGTKVADHWICEFTIDAKADPWINSVLSITNTTPTTQTYTFTVTLPISPALPAPTQHGGSMQGGLTNNPNPPNMPAVVATAGAPLYLGMIDGVGVLPIYPDPTSFTAVQDYSSTSIPAVNVLPPTLPSGAVTSTIGIQHKFTLTAGDSATFSSIFVVVPEPATLALLAMGGFAVARRRRG